MEPVPLAYQAKITTHPLTYWRTALQPLHREIGVDELADRSAATVLREVAPFANVSGAYHSVSIDLALPHLPTPSQVAERTRSIINKGVVGMPIVEITLPPTAGPADVIREVAPHL